jgi:hypothetical protein
MLVTIGGVSLAFGLTVSIITSVALAKLEMVVLLFP